MKKLPFKIKLMNLCKNLNKTLATREHWTSFTRQNCAFKRSCDKKQKAPFLGAKLGGMSLVSEIPDTSSIWKDEIIFKKKIHKAHRLDFRRLPGPVLILIFSRTAAGNRTYKAQTS